jgi:hypothetical protein
LRGAKFTRSKAGDVAGLSSSGNVKKNAQ